MIVQGALRFRDCCLTGDEGAGTARSARTAQA
jgi:hypothetical protein